MEKKRNGTQCAYEDSIERELAAGKTLGEITDEAFKGGQAAEGISLQVI